MTPPDRGDLVALAIATTGATYTPAPPHVRTAGFLESFSQLPHRLDGASGFEAHLNDGMLTIRLPRPDYERPRRIQIQ